jgi:hypothetical protein
LMAEHSSDFDLHSVSICWVLPTEAAALTLGRAVLEAAAEKSVCQFANVDSARQLRALIESLLL